MDLCESGNFNIFKIRDLTNGNEAVTVVLSLLARQNVFVDLLKLNYIKLKNFLKGIQDGYKNITYHNKTHGADLCQTFYLFCTRGELAIKAKFDSVDFLSYLVAAACHDFEHPGVNQVFLCQKKQALALRYNDKSVLENHHAAASYKLM